MAGQEQNTGRRPGVKHRTWIWQFDNPVPEIWPVMSDTARFNEAAELPKQIIEDVPQSDGSVRYMAHANLGLLRLAWEEMPVNWVSNRWFEHCRHFHKGPPQESLRPTPNHSRRIRLPRRVHDRGRGGQSSWPGCLGDGIFFGHR